MKAEVSNAPSTKNGAPASKAQDGKLRNLTGRVNNLVTSDFASVRAGWDFLYLGVSNRLRSPVRLTSSVTTVVKAPLELACCIWFLYAILGWR